MVIFVVFFLRIVKIDVGQYSKFLISTFVELLCVCTCGHTLDG